MVFSVQFLCFFVFPTLFGTSSAAEPLRFNFSNFSVAEESPVGTDVGVVGQQAESPAVPAELRYRLRPSSSSTRFSINELTGVLRTAEVLDREELCPYQPVCELAFHVIGVCNLLLPYGGEALRDGPGGQ